MSYSGGYASGYLDGGIPTPPIPTTPTGNPSPLAEVWTFAAGPWTSMPVTAIADGAARSVTWRLTGNHEASFTITDDAARYASLDLGPTGTTAAAGPTLTSVDVRIGSGNMQGPYSTSDSSRMAQLPSQVALITGGLGPIDLFGGVECHEGGMDTLLLGRVKAVDSDWALAGGDSGNKLFYRPSLYSVVKAQSLSMTGGRDMADFTMRHVTGAEIRVFVAHLRSDDDDGTPRDKERESEIRFLAKRALPLRNVVLVGDFNFKPDTIKKLRGILATSGLLGLQTRFPNIAHGGDASGTGNGDNNGRWIDDIFTKSDQTVVDAAGVKAGDASDHYLWDRAVVRFATSTIVTASSSLGPQTNDGGIKELIWDLWVIRNGQALFRGRIGPSSDSFDESGSVSTQFGAADYREMLNRRMLFEGDTVDFTNVEQSDIAWTLISQTQAHAGGNMGIVRGAGAVTGVKRDRSTYAAGDFVGPTIDLLSQVSNGFDWDITPNLNDTSMTFDVFYPGRGTSRDVVLDYGGRVKSANRQVDPGAFGNAVRGTGADTLTPVRVESNGLATDPAGRWDLQYAGDTITVAQTLQDRTTKVLADAQDLTPSWSVVLTPGTWNGPDDFWLGDTVTLVVKAGRHNAVETLRVMEIDLALDENNVATITVVLGAPDPKLKRTVRTINKRLSALERR